MTLTMYVTPDPQLVKEAEERESLELLAQSSILSIRVEKAEERQRARAEFWRTVAERESQKRGPFRMVREQPERDADRG